MDAEIRLKFIEAMLRLQVFGDQEMSSTVKGLSRSEIKEELESLTTQGLLRHENNSLPYQLYVIANDGVARAWGKELLEKMPKPQQQPTTIQSKTSILAGILDLHRFTMGELLEYTDSDPQEIIREISSLKEAELIDFAPEDTGNGKTLHLYQVRDDNARSQLFEQLKDLRGKMRVEALLT